MPELDNFWASVDQPQFRERMGKPKAMYGGHVGGAGLSSRISGAARRSLGGIDFSRGANWPESELRTLRMLSRAASISGTVGPSIISARVNSAVTGGLKLMSMPIINGSLSEEMGNIIEALWSYYISEPVTGDGLSGIESVCEISAAAALIDGDAFAVISYSEERKTATGYGTVVDIVPGCLVCNPNDQPNSDKIINGLELSPGGWVSRIHVLQNKFSGQRTWRAIDVFMNGPFGKPVRNVFPIRCSGREVAGMFRVLPLFSPVLEHIDALNEFRKAFIIKAKNEAAMNFVAKGLTGVSSSNGYDIPSNDTTDYSVLTHGDFKSFELHNGTTVYLPANGTELESFKMATSAFNYEKESKAIAAEVACACDVPPEVVTRLFSSSYSGGTAALNESWRSRVPADRARVAKGVAGPLLMALLDEAVASGELNIPGYAESQRGRNGACNAKWLGPLRGSINPGAEYRARAIAEDRGWILPEENAAELFGSDFYEQAPSLFRAASIQGTMARIKDYRFKQGNKQQGIPA